MSKQYSDEVQDYLDYLVDKHEDVKYYWQIMNHAHNLSQCPGLEEEQKIIDKVKRLIFDIGPKCHPILLYSSAMLLHAVTLGNHREMFEELKRKSEQNKNYN